MNPLPIQPAKIHCPLPRDDTLSRDRLNSWVERAAAGRLALIVAEAGFGKTTLLADWARHTRRMTAWYRLESDDRDWLTFIRHVVAGGRELDPQFAPDTYALLMALESGGATQQELVVSLAREASAFGTGSARGFTLILDDYHVIDGFAETEPIVRALVDRTGPGFSVVISTRTTPRLSLGRVRARGGVMTLEGADLCFDVDETTRLFRDAYHRPLDEDIVSDLWDRTEGWAALLTLVRTGLEDEGHHDARDLVAHLDASTGDLYEFLADEVLASLPADLQSFLKRVALLAGVDVASAVLASGLETEHVTAAIADCERLGLLTRPDRESPHRFHPLVREFLVARLTAEIGAEAVRDLHASLARALEPDDWIAAGWHYRAAGDVEAAARVLDRAVPVVIAEGHLDHVRQFLDGSAGSPTRPGALLLRSRLEIERGNLSRAMQLAEEAAALGSEGDLAGPILMNLAAVRSVHGFDEQGLDLAARAMKAGLTPADRLVAEASMVVSGTQTDGDMAAAADYLTALAITQDRAGHSRYAGVTRLNLALILLWQGRNREALRAARAAEVLLGTNAQSPERAAAAAVRVSALVQLGNVDELRQLATMADEVRSPLGREEAAMETARLAADYGPLNMAETYLGRMGTLGEQYGYKGSRAAIAAAIELRRGNAGAAGRVLSVGEGRLQDAAGQFRVGVLHARISLASKSATVDREIDELARLAVLQRSRLAENAVHMLSGLHTGDIDAAVARLAPDERHLLSVFAEELSTQLPRLSSGSREQVQEEAALRPDRWRTALRLVYTVDPEAANLLASIANADDAEAMRAAAVTHKWLRPAAAQATRRLAPRILIRDLGAVGILMGEGAIERPMRRKVLALLCLVSSRPGMAVTRDEALDAIWPDLGPDTAVNSLHQTIYYLRRVLEPHYREGVSAGYVQFDGEVLSLDGELVDTLSRRCWRLLSPARAIEAGALDTLLATYRGMYALDFAYEEWALGYRENLHAAVLAAVEQGIRSAVARGEPELGVDLAHRMLGLDPTADAIELELLKAYKASGRLAAAAEQYAHYATYVRGELGTEPPPFADL